MTIVDLTDPLSRHRSVYQRQRLMEVYATTETRVDAEGVECTYRTKKVARVWVPITFWSSRQLWDIEVHGKGGLSLVPTDEEARTVRYSPTSQKD